MLLDFKIFYFIFQVMDLQVFVLPRITLKPLVPSFPCFASIYVSLMEKVSVDLLLLSLPTYHLNTCKTFYLLITYTVILYSFVMFV